MSYGPYGQAVPPPPPPKRGMSTGAKIGIGCGGCLGVSVIGFVFLLVLGAIVGDTDSGGGETVAASPDSAESSAPEEAAAEEEPAAEEAAVTMTATHAGTVGDTIDDTVYTAIDVEIVNNSDEPIDVNPINFNAVLADGTVVSDWADTVFADIDTIDAVTLQPGQKASGQIAVVGEVDVATVEMAELFGTGDPVVAEVQ